MNPEDKGGQAKTPDGIVRTVDGSVQEMPGSTQAPTGGEQSVFFQAYVGPLPPAMIAEYNRVVPGLGERLIGADLTGLVLVFIVGRKTEPKESTKQDPEHKDDGQ